ncbi:Ig-like domain-containing protein [Vibrio parahaemolyticus]
MTQLFRDDEACNYFFEIMKTTKRDNYIDDLVKMSKEARESKVFGYALYDSGAFPQLSNLSRDFFAANYTAILSAMTSAGVFDSYILLVRQIMGDSTLIYHEIKNPGHLIIKIAGVESSLSKLATSDEMQIATSELAGILVSVPISDFAIVQLKKTIEALCQPGGVYVELMFIYPDSVAITPSSGVALVGNSMQFTAEITYTDGSISNAAQWRSSDSTVASVSSSGLVTALSHGTVQIYAAPYGNASYEKSAEFNSVSVSSIELSVSENIDIPETAVATIVYSDGSTVSSIENPEIVTWKSSDISTLTVDDAGYCYPVNPGSSSITVTSVEDASISVAENINVFASTAKIIIGTDGIGKFGYQNANASDPDILFGELIWANVGNGIKLDAIRAANDFRPVSIFANGTSGVTTWNDWHHIKLTFRFQDETIIKYPGILTTPSLYTYTSQDSGIIDETLVNAMQSRVGQECYITAEPVDALSETIEIVIGEHIESSNDTTYGLRSSVGIGELVSGTFPDGSPVRDIFARTIGQGEYLRSKSVASAWYGDFTLEATWEFEDGTMFEAKSSSLTYGRDKDEMGNEYIRYKTSHIYDELIELMSTRVGERAKIHIIHSTVKSHIELIQV